MDESSAAYAVLTEHSFCCQVVEREAHIWYTLSMNISTPTQHVRAWLETLPVEKKPTIMSRRSGSTLENCATSGVSACNGGNKPLAIRPGRYWTGGHEPGGIFLMILWRSDL